MSFQSDIDKAVGVFVKAQKKLESLIDRATNRVVKIDSEIDVLEVEKTEVKGAMQRAINIKKKILDIVGDDV